MKALAAVLDWLADEAWKLALPALIGWAISDHDYGSAAFASAVFVGQLVELFVDREK